MVKKGQRYDRVGYQINNKIRHVPVPVTAKSKNIPQLDKSAQV